jgi:hypothetical protein
VRRSILALTLVVVAAPGCGGGDKKQDLASCLKDGGLVGVKRHGNKLIALPPMGEGNGAVLVTYYKSAERAKAGYRSMRAPGFRVELAGNRVSSVDSELSPKTTKVSEDCLKKSD